MKKKHFSTTFSKITAAFVAFGLLPLLVMSLLFYFRYSVIFRDTIISNCSAVTGYVSKNVGEVLNSVDDAMGDMYDYRDAQGRTLKELMKDGSLNASERELGIDTALREILSKSEYISSLRMVDETGEIFSLYYSQDKTLSKEAYSHTSMSVFAPGEDPTDLKLFGTIPEEEICINSEDYVFGMVRNYMDTSSIGSARTRPLGTLFADINVNVISDIVQKAGIQKGHVYVLSTQGARYIYSDRTEDYLNGEHPLRFCEDLLDGGSGYARLGHRWVFYEKIDDINAYAVMVMENSEFMGSFIQTRVILVLILCFSCAFLMILYMVFSIRMSAPTRQLKEAMEQMEEGNLDVRVHLNTQDEMEYVADGFNKMAEKLTDYINQVYVAQICQKDAELNALKMQIQPHYLYNTLDVIRMTALEQGDRKTAELLESLARQLRYLIGNQSDRVNVKDELDAIREYFVLMRARYEGRISLMIDIADKDQKLMIPKLILQPVVENAIRHGLREK